MIVLRDTNQCVCFVKQTDSVLCLSVARVGLMHIGVFILLLLSGERNFGVRLNKPYSLRVPMDIPVFTGTHADLLIVVRAEFFLIPMLKVEFNVEVKMRFSLLRSVVSQKNVLQFMTPRLQTCVLNVIESCIYQLQNFTDFLFFFVSGLLQPKILVFAAYFLFVCFPISRCSLFRRLCCFLENYLISKIASTRF